MATVMSARDGSNLADVVELILEKGIVIDAWVEVGLLGIPILSVKARVVISSVDTYLRYAEALGMTVAQPAPQVLLPANAAWLPPATAPRVLPAAPPVPVTLDVGQAPLVVASPSRNQESATAPAGAPRTPGGPTGDGNQDMSKETGGE